MMTYTVTFLLLYDIFFFVFVLNKAITTALSADVSSPQRSMVSPTPWVFWCLRNSQDSLQVLFSAQTPSHTKFFSIPLFNMLHASPALCCYLSWSITDPLVPKRSKCQVVGWNKREMNLYQRRRERKEGGN